VTDERHAIVILGLSLSSSWGNGHATTWRALIKGLHRLGQRVLFLERDVPWYAANRDLADPATCRLAFYRDLAELEAAFGASIEQAGAVLVGSYVPDGVAVLDLALERARGPVLFYDIDTPVTLASLEHEQPTYIEPRQIPALDGYLSFAGGPILQRLAETYGARAALPFYCAVDADVYRPLPTTPDWELGYLGTYSPDRQPTLETLLIEPARRLPGRRFVVAGPGYPDDIDWPANVERISHLPPDEHPRFYSRQRFTLNVTRADMIRAGWSPSVRLFEAAACETPIISDSWPGLTELFPENEAIILASTAEEVVSVIGRISDEWRRRLAAAARRRVLDGHTGEARAGQLLAILDRLGSTLPRLPTTQAEAAFRLDAARHARAC
jgi:spore maturation protein CgeB